MAIIELEFTRDKFAALIDFSLSLAPIPTPTLPVLLGPDRLISDFRWKGVSIDEALAGYQITGTVSCWAALTIWHVSIAELRLNEGALGSKIDTMAGLIISATPEGLLVNMVALRTNNNSPQFFPPILIAKNSLPSTDGPPPVLAAIVRDANYFTVRFATSTSDSGSFLLPPASRLATTGGDWLIRVSPEAFVDQVVSTIREGLTPPPAGTNIEDQPTGGWGYISERNEWGVRASVGIEKIDACPSLFGKVDVSVDVNVIASISADKDKQVVNTWFRISSDASDWDTFRCWLGGGAIAGTLLGGIGGAVTFFFVQLGSLIATGEIIRRMAGEAVTDKPLKDKTLINQDDTSVTYTGTNRLPVLPKANVLDAFVGQDGLIVYGQQLSIPAEHDPQFNPNGGVVPSLWHGHYSCKEHRWKSDYLLQSIDIQDQATVLGVKLKLIPVSVFYTSIVEPDNLWRLILPDGPPAEDQFVAFEAVNPQPGNQGIAYIHTSAGIRRFDFGPIPQPPAEPDQLALGVMQVNCRRWQKMRDLRGDLMYLPDPPPFKGILPAVRQWQITFQYLMPETIVQIRQRGPAGDQTIEITAGEGGEGAVEFLTDAETTVSLDYSIEPSVINARMVQRWLAPMRSWNVDERVIHLSKSRQGIFVRTEHSILEIDPYSGIIRSQKLMANASVHHTPKIEISPLHMSEALPFSITLQDGRVMAVWKHQIILARPWRTVSTLPGSSRLLSIGNEALGV